MRIVVFGNSGSGKSTLARSLAGIHGLVHLDLDSIVWVPGQTAVQREAAEVVALLQRFIEQNPDWVIEGCYGELVEQASLHCSQLIFLNPGREACLANNLRRPLEPHKYATLEEQNAMLDGLQAWVAGYYERTDRWSYTEHRRLFSAFAGNKVEHTRPPAIGAAD